MKVSLVIDGDATGAVKAAGDTSRALDGVADKTAAVSKKTDESMARASGAVGSLANASKAQGAANDNAANSTANYAQRIGDLASKALGAENALARVASGIGNFVSRFAEVAGATSKFTFLTGAIGLAITAAQTLFDIIQSGSRAANSSLIDHERLVSTVRAAYADAANAAGKFYDTSKSITQLRLLEQEQKLRDQLQSSVGSALPNLYRLAPMQEDSNILGNWLSGTKQVREEFRAFEDAIFKLQAGFKDGTPDVKAFMDEVGRIALANPQLQMTGLKLAGIAQQAEEDAKRLRLTQDARAVIEGRAKPEQRENVLGRAQSTTTASANEFDRLTKSIEKQAAALEAESASIGKSTGEAAKLRAEMLLLEAAKQAGIKVSGEYAEKMEAVASRIGAASQRAAELRLNSDINFERSQLGRSNTDAMIADRLRSVYGDNVESQMNGAAANAMRLNEYLRDVRATTTDLAQGAFRDFVSQIRSGASAFDALRNAGVNALNKIAEKLLDKALDSALSRLFGGFGSFLGFGGSSGPAMGGPINVVGAAGGMAVPTFFDVGGYTGDGGKHEPAGIVHRGEYVFDADSTRAIGVGNLNQMRRSLRGYADGGYVSDSNVIPFRPASATRQADPVAAGMTVHVNDNRTITINGGGDIEAIRRELDRDRNDFTARVTDVVQTLQKKGSLR
ncbi:hypothetical protein X566_01545 [Afipia sp. P52-10]|uniref:phage tail tape measure protein n=1 Tax=Afipia sp. P52-10 TaxID=1429916 RepID=UPI0003DF4057|nr:phage tail tape measure protein [Afipia sp. P52-10]ETR79330.1 hypothetical protein X566_01545 [Afipia sp. P52-10]